MSLPPMTLDELIVYFESVFETCALTKMRLAKLEADGPKSIREVGRLQAMAKLYLDALVQTRDMHEARRRYPSGGA
ncbi:MAG: hypothetical protein H0V97_03330 [Actinobacteria bacterium]|nr:hypothetical protein [Actinomycetota bacterium]